MYKKLTEKEYETVLKFNHKAIIYDSKKYVNFIQAILNNDFFSKRIDISHFDDYISLFDVCEEIENIEDVAKYFNKNSKIVYNFGGIDILELYNTYPRELFDYEPDFDSSVNYITFISMFLYGFDSKITLNNKVVFDFEEHLDYSYSIINISFESLKEIMDIYKNLFIKDYKINNISILNYFNVRADNKQEFLKKIEHMSKIEEF